MRDLVEATASRTIVELCAVHERAPWMAGLRRSWEDWGYTPGGTVFSLNPIDQSRLLAVGFHRLIEQLVRADVPILFLAFPRLAEDPDYLFGKLAPVLPPGITLERMRQSHRQIARGELVRVGRELRGNRETEHHPPERQTEAPRFEELDNIALRREIGRLRNRLAGAEAAAQGFSELRRWRVVRFFMFAAGVLGVK